jgi:hypothetical protein
VPAPDGRGAGTFAFAKNRERWDSREQPAPLWPLWISPFAPTRKGNAPLGARTGLGRDGGVEQAFGLAARSGAWTALTSEVRIDNSSSSDNKGVHILCYRNVEPRRDLFQVEKIARLFIENMLSYREQKKYLLHGFVVMPDHFHLILSPTGITLERAMQCVKGGFSFQLNKNLYVPGLKCQ